MPVGPSTYGAAYPQRSVTADTSGFGVDLGAGVTFVNDGTPSRVAGVLLVAGGTLAALKLLGFRFNVGVSG